MELVTLIGITVAAALVIILVGALVNYMSSLVKSAYQIKVELRNDLETALNDMREDIDKRSKWLKRDLVEETTKVKDSLEMGNGRKLDELRETLTALASEAREAGRAEVAALIEEMHALEARLRAMEQETEARKNMARRVREKADSSPTESPAKGATPPPNPATPPPAAPVSGAPPPPGSVTTI
jgi:cell division protein FtsX